MTRISHLIFALMLPVPCFGAMLSSSAHAQSAGEGAAAGKTDGAIPGDGQLLFNNTCRTCHATKAGDNRLGPSLANIVGRKAGEQAGYQYSPAMKAAGVTWDEKTLDAFIANPDQVVAGHNMKPYTGMSSAEDRAKIIAFLGGGAGQSPDTDNKATE